MDPLEQIRQLLRDRFGLSTVRPDDIAQAMRNLHGTSTSPSYFSELARRMAESPALLKELAGRVTLSESYFSRHPEQIEAVVRLALARISSGELVRIWSAGCARGEEPYTIALRLLESLGPAAMSRAQITASDIDSDSIEIAKSGRFSAWSLRTTTHELLQHFSSQSNGQYLIRHEVRQWLEFHHLSIQDHLARLAPQSLDVILFRNVGIYLSQDALTSIHGAFHRLLRDTGVLVQAVTDPVPQAEWFHARGALVPGMYRPASSRIHSASLTAPAVAGPTPARDDETNRRRNRPKPRAEEARRMASRSSGGPSAVIRRHEPEQSLPPDLCAAQGKIENGEPQAAVEALRSTLYLYPDDYLARYWYCVALRAADASSRALQQARQLKAQLSGNCGDRVLTDHRTTIAELEQAVDELLEEIQ